MVPRDPNMAEQDRRTADGEAEYTSAQVQSPERTGTDTRRTSVSSAGVRSDPSRTVDMQASYTSAQSEGQRSRPRPQRLDYGSMRSESQQQTQGVLPGGVQTLSPQSLQVPRRPGAGRRAPSSAHPHRGEVFSTEDDPDEVDSDLRLARTQSKSEVRRELERERERDRERQLRRHDSSTLRRRTIAQPPPLQTVDSSPEDEQVGQSTGAETAPPPIVEEPVDGDPSSEETLQGEEEEEEEEEAEDTPTPDDTDDADLSDAESFTLKDRQDAINETHPFGIRIWKPALYKKSRSVQRNAEGDIHSAPGGNVSRTLFVFNFLWTLVFGWWLSIIAAVGGIVCMILSLFQLPGCYDYGRVLINLSHYLFYPFGKYVKLDRDEAYLEEDEGEGRSITDYERWQTGDLEEGRLFFGPQDLNRSLIGRRRDEVSGPDETDSLLGRPQRQSNQDGGERGTRKKRFFGRGTWNFGRVVFFLSFYFLITPCLFLVSAICWFLVFTIPMGKVTLLLFYHLRRHPLAMSFHTDHGFSRQMSIERGSNGSSILLCTYRAVGLRYWKYTIDGTNIFLINLLALVVFVIFDYFILYETLGIENGITNLGFIFMMALLSIIPLAYFIGQAVASISAQSSMGVGATVNAFFATIVEVFLYCVALKEGKSALVEGSIIGSIFAGILFLPGISMCFGAIKRKTQRFNVKSAGVTSTMLLFAVIGAFGPTLFYQMYGSHEMKCKQCMDVDPSYMRTLDNTRGADRDCRRCYFSQTPAIHSRFYLDAVRPFIYFATICLFLSYVVGLFFTLRTHAAVIWNNEPDEKKDAKMDQAAHRVEERQSSITGPQQEESRLQLQRQPTLNRDNSIRDSQMYKRILSQSLKQVGINAPQQPLPTSLKKPDDSTTAGYFSIPAKDSDIADSSGGLLHSRIQGLSAEDNRALMQEIAEMAATAATVAARDATRAPRRASVMLGSGSAPRKRDGSGGGSKDPPKDAHKQGSTGTGTEPSTLGMESETAPAAAPQAIENAPPGAAEPGHEQGGEGGHDAPNWSRAKSATILLTATVAYAIIAEILVDTVDVVLSSVTIDEKFLGITLFALVPNTTEFLNAIAFAMNGNVALSMEIGSSYALQVMLLQIPCLVLFSGIYNLYFSPAADAGEVLRYTFTLIFPQWDMVTTILSVFLMGWVVGEGKSNYFKGSILIFTYLVIVVGFWFSGFNNVEDMAVDVRDTLALGASPSFQQTFKTVGRGTSGFAY